MSIDHDWGPRLFIFLREEDAEQGDDLDNLQMKMCDSCLTIHDRHVRVPKKDE